MILDRFDLSGKTAIITGGGRGLGRAMAIAFAEAGADVVVSARSVEQIEEAAARIRELGRRAVAVSCDITDSSQVNAMVERAYGEFGEIDVLINNAGGSTGGSRNALPEISDEQWRTGIDTNLSGAFYCSRAVVPRMAKRGTGTVINVSSGFGLRVSRDNYIYTSAKAALIQFTRALAISYAANGVRANVIAPGIVPHTEEAAARYYHGKYIPIGRVGKSEDIALLAVFLASDGAAYINGEVLVSDGGGLATGIALTGMAPVWPE